MSRYLSTKQTDYQEIFQRLSLLPDLEQAGHYRNLCRYDLYFLIRYACGRADLDNPWLFARCREVQASPNGHLDLWSRDHRKSTIITFGKTIQDVLLSHGDGAEGGRECCFGIFSHTRPIAKGFLIQIKRELETNVKLKSWFPDVLWQEPGREAPKWSEDGGLIVKRTSNPKEATIEAWGLVDGQPTGKHFTHLVYDDVVTRESVTTPEQIEKTTEALALSYNLGSQGGIRRFVGTRYHFADTYKTLADRKTAVLRVHPATVDGKADGLPVLLSREALAEKRRDMGPYVFNAQMLLNPVADGNQTFLEPWLRFWQVKTRRGLNVYILCDPASSKKKGSDYTVFWVIGLGEDGNIYVLDLIRDRLNLTERAEMLFHLHRQYFPKKVGWERYGMMADIEHIEYRMKEDNYRFEITELGGAVSKMDRISRLVPYFEQGRIYLPVSRMYRGYDGKERDLVQVFVDEEFKVFPLAEHDDCLDALARIDDLGVVWPIRRHEGPGDVVPEREEVY